MNAQRETSYRCTFSSPRSRFTAHVRAWDVAEAVQLFRHELSAEGVEERGTIEVSDLHGSGLQRVAYQPETETAAEAESSGC